MKHGLTALRITIPGEDPADWLAFRTAHFELWKPVGPVETELVEALAGFSWRLRRGSNAEASAIRRAMAHSRGAVGTDAASPLADGVDGLLGEVFMELDERGFLTKALPRYEARLARQRKATIALLLQVQELRRERDEVERRGRERPRAARTLRPLDLLRGHNGVGRRGIDRAKRAKRQPVKASPSQECQTNPTPTDGLASVPGEELEPD
jgi:hypothetical protein